VKHDHLFAVRQAILDTLYAGASPEFLSSEIGQIEIDDHVAGRSQKADATVIPWLSRIIDLQDKAIVEFGCGTGAIATTFAQHGARVHGYEIDPARAEAARRRAALMELDSCAFDHAAANDLPEVVRAQWDGQADIALLFAVLEHTTHQESINLIRSAWSCLRPGGLLVVNDTPNRLSFFDYHTSHMPFFNNMSDEMVAIEAYRSPRDGFKAAFAEQPMTEQRREDLVRWGRGVSYHAFETAIGPQVHDYVALTGFEKEIADEWPIFLEDTLMMTYFKAKPIHAHEAFARSALNLVLRKPE
jgi:S-adenosylmethionine-dependent methyltransferase